VQPPTKNVSNLTSPGATKPSSACNQGDEEAGYIRKQS
jgi:hypothetical protein